MLFAAISIRCIANQQSAALYTVMFWLLGQKLQSLGKKFKRRKNLNARFGYWARFHGQCALTISDYSEIAPRYADEI